MMGTCGIFETHKPSFDLGHANETPGPNLEGWHYASIKHLIELRPPYSGEQSAFGRRNRQAFTCLPVEAVGIAGHCVGSCVLV
jgi:hypothetical protein